VVTTRSSGASKGTAALIGRVAPRVSARFVSGDGPASLPARLVTAPTPGTGSGYISWWDRFLERRALARLAREATARRARRSLDGEQAPPAPGIEDAIRMSQAQASPAR
jgi:hypothetical protein